MQAFQRIKHNGPNPIPDPETIPLKMCLDENKVDKSKYDFETDEVLISGYYQIEIALPVTPALTVGLGRI